VILLENSNYQKRSKLKVQLVEYLEMVTIRSLFLSFKFDQILDRQTTQPSLYDRGPRK
jgi:hypothetical protein